ncbi:MAG: hypothetical protein VX519_00645, partial [Myxococcota bacterium]|nr:hypothetical protein [Myxococcota bacterium]
VSGVAFVWWVMRFYCWFPLLLLVGCVPVGTESGSGVDTDGDGLTDELEASLGTDPSVADTDGDGESDGDEVAGNTSPLDADDHAYQGGWSIAACRDAVVATGNEVGEIAEDFSLLDQFGDRVRLHSFCDSVVWLVGAAFW